MLAADPSTSPPPFVQPSPYPPAVQGHTSLPVGAERESVAQRFEVSVTVLGSLGVTLTLQGEDAKDPNALIEWATVVAAPAVRSGENAPLKANDELIRLNDQPIRGLTLRQFADMVYAHRRAGTLTWKVRRGVLGREFTTVFNGSPQLYASAAEAW